MKLLKTVWQLPQYIVGFIILKVTKAEYMHNKDDITKVYQWNKESGISLGKYIFVPSNADTNYINHEYGHSLQSLYLGWLYLIVIGLPSLIWCAFRGKSDNYYDFYTERWADKLGKVVRQ